MLATGALDRHKVLVILHGDVMETSDARRIAEWVKKGGRLIVMGVPKLESVEATSDPEKLLFADTPTGRTLGKGSVSRVSDWPALASALRSTLTGLSLPVYDLKKDGVFATQIARDRFLFLNTGDEAKVEVEVKGKRTEASAAGRTITEVGL